MALGYITRGFDDSYRETKIPSVNEPFKVLIAEGLCNVLKCVQADLEPCQGYYDIYHILMEFLIQRPNARYVSMDNFPDRFTEQQERVCRGAIMTTEGWEGRKLASRVDVANRYAFIRNGWRS